MKIALIIPNQIDNAPFIDYYTDVFDENQNIEYFYITWKRDDKSLNYPLKKKTYEFSVKSPITLSNIKKIYHYKLFANYAKSVLNKEEVDYVIVYTIQEGIFMYNYLKKNFNGKYIFDIRDYSPIYPFSKKRVKSLIKHSSFTVISSLGYKQWLPQTYNYILSHNIRKRLILKAINENNIKTTFKQAKPIKILTIGQIRDFSSNSKVINLLQNKDDFELYFVGDGIGVKSLKNFAIRANNVYFEGRYMKPDEGFIVKKCDLINILLPDSIAHNTPMSNRFYLSLIHKKPMIVNVESCQAHYVLKYKVGLILEKNNCIDEKILEYRTLFQNDIYEKGCNNLLLEIKEDIENFESSLKKIIY